MINKRCSVRKSVYETLMNLVSRDSCKEEIQLENLNETRKYIESNLRNYGALKFVRTNH